MKKLLIIIALAIASPVFAGDWLGISTQEFQKRMSESKIILVLHWNPDTSDYQEDQIKGRLIREAYLGGTRTWKKYFMEFRNDPTLIFVFIENDEVQNGHYIGRSWATPSIDQALDEKNSMQVSEALKLLKEKKDGA